MESCGIKHESSTIEIGKIAFTHKSSLNHIIYTYMYYVHVKYLTERDKFQWFGKLARMRVCVSACVCDVINIYILNFSLQYYD